MELPSDVWSVIFSFCDAEVLASSVHFVCKNFKRLEDDEILWKAKCLQRNLDVSFKKLGETWKQFYFYRPLELFPLYGIKMGKTTGDELKAIPGVEINQMQYATVNKVNFWFNTDSKIFRMMYLVNGIYILPKEWEDIGITYNRSWKGYLTYLKQYFHNYQIKQTPHLTDFQDKKCFTATVATVSKCDDVYFHITFTFGYHEGNENSKNTLYSISINCESGPAEKVDFRNRYNNKVIDNNGYIMEDEEKQAEILQKELIRTAPKIRRLKPVKIQRPKVIPPVNASGIVIPREIWTIIFDNCEPQAIVLQLSSVCKFFKQLSDDEQFWEKKCMQIQRDPNAMLIDETWKKYYFSKHFAMFPLYGAMINKTTEAELHKNPLATKATDGECFTIHQTNFWVNNADRVFRMMYIARGIYPIPEEWIALGINWERSFADYLIYLKRTTGNYQIVEAPKQRFVLNKSCFESCVQAVVRHNNTFFVIVLMFGYVEGTASSPNTLYSITIRAANTSNDHNNWIELHEGRVIKHKDEDLSPPKEEPEKPATEPADIDGFPNLFEPEENAQDDELDEGDPFNFDGLFD